MSDDHDDHHDHIHVEDIDLSCTSEELVVNTLKGCSAVLTLLLNGLLALVLHRSTTLHSRYLLLVRNAVIACMITSVYYLIYALVVVCVSLRDNCEVLLGDHAWCFRINSPSITAEWVIMLTLLCVISDRLYAVFYYQTYSEMSANAVKVAIYLIWLIPIGITVYYGFEVLNDDAAGHKHHCISNQITLSSSDVIFKNEIIHLIVSICAGIVYAVSVKVQPQIFSDSQYQAGSLEEKAAIRQISMTARTLGPWVIMLVCLHVLSSVIMWCGLAEGDYFDLVVNLAVMSVLPLSHFFFDKQGRMIMLKALGLSTLAETLQKKILGEKVVDTQQQGQVHRDVVEQMWATKASKSLAGKGRK